MSPIVSCPSRATLLASTKRPSTSISPNVRASRMWATSLSVEGTGRLTSPAQRSALVPVGAWAYVSGRVEGAATERAGGAPGSDHLGAAAGEGTGQSRVDHDTQDRLELSGALGLEPGLALLIDLDLLLSVMALQDDDTSRGIPSESHRADPELVLDGRVQRCNILDGLGHSVRGLAARKVVEQIVDPVGERPHLLLLKGHTG